MTLDSIGYIITTCSIASFIAGYMTAEFRRAYRLKKWKKENKVSDSLKNDNYIKIVRVGFSGIFMTMYISLLIYTSFVRPDVIVPIYVHIIALMVVAFLFGYEIESILPYSRK